MKALKGLDGSFKDVAKSAGFAAANFAAAGVLQNVTQYIDEAVVVTQKFERNMLALSQVFESNTGKMRQFTEESVNMGISQSQAAQASVFLGSVLKQYGVSASETTVQTQKLVTLSQDLATTYGYDLSEALVAVTALFRGEYDPIEKFGVAMKQSEINALLAARGQDKLTGSLLMQASVQARLDLLYERSADAFGAFQRAGDTLYVAQQKLNATLENQQIAFGQGLQKPLADTTDLFNELASSSTGLMESLGTATGNTITVLNVFLELMVQLAGPALEGLNTGLTLANNFFEVTRLRIQAASEELEKFLGLSQDDGILKVGNDLANSIGADVALGNAIEFLNTQLENSIYMFEAGDVAVENYRYAVENADTELKRFNLQAERTGIVVEEAEPILSQYAKNLKTLGIYSVDAEGNLTGLAGVFDDIEIAAQQSSASEVLKDIGFNAGQIETILTKPDWAEIFGQISRLAKVAAIDISKIGGSAQYAAAAAQGAANATLEKLLEDIKGDESTSSDTPAKKPRDAVKALFNELRGEVNKQAASIKLAAMGASEGLIQLILGDKDWSKLWQQIKTGAISLKDLQKQFNNTAAGVRELEDALEAARDQAQAFIDEQQSKKDELEQVWIAAKARAEDFKKTIAEIANIKILPTISKEVGQFEQQIISFIDSIQTALKQGFESGAIFEADYLALKDYANQETILLQSIARQRDDLANRYKLSEALIAEYESAFKSAASLTSLFGKLKTETEKRTVTEITRSVAQLSGSLKEFNITVTREYEETIDKVVNKSEGLLNGFRDMAVKARSFAENLRKLKDMGLNGELFNELVQAGVEAGGETAQALVEGGADTINEINGLFDEISVLGANLGLEAATELYGSGIDMVDGLIDGILSQQSALEAAAQSLADAFNAKFQASVSIATAKPVAAAEAAFNNVIVPKLDEIDVAGLAQLNAYLENAGKALGVVTGIGTRAGIENKIDIVEMLRQDVLTGAKLDLSGIVSGLTSSELMAAAQSSGSTTVNNYYTTIQPGDRLAQNNTVESLQTFANANGNIGSWVAL
jgi:hypothetical protein